MRCAAAARNLSGVARASRPARSAASSAADSGQATSAPLCSRSRMDVASTTIRGRIALAGQRSMRVSGPAVTPGGQQVRRAERHADGIARRTRGDDGGHGGQVGDGEFGPGAEPGDDLGVSDGALVARAWARLHRLAPIGDVGLVVGGADAEGCASGSDGRRRR